MGKDIRKSAELFGFMIGQAQRKGWPHGSYRSNLFDDAMWLSQNPGKDFLWAIWQNGTRIFDLERRSWNQTILESMVGTDIHYFVFKDNKFEAISWERAKKL